MAELRFKTIGLERSQELLGTYVSDFEKFGWPLYDQDPSPSTLVGVDLASPALLSYPIKSKYLNEMGRQTREGQEPNDYNMLFKAMVEFVNTESAEKFWEVPRSAIAALAGRESGATVEGPSGFAKLIACLDAAQPCTGIRSVAVTKILHRKRPDLVPINDSRVRKFYGVKNSYPPVFSAIHNDLQDPETFKMLKDLASPYTGLDDRPMSILRALDIVIWMYMSKESV
jgi:hypothetical protein